MKGEEGVQSWMDSASSYKLTGKKKNPRLGMQCIMLLLLPVVGQVELERQSRTAMLPALESDEVGRYLLDR